MCAANFLLRAECPSRLPYERAERVRRKLSLAGGVSFSASVIVHIAIARMGGAKELWWSCAVCIL